MNKVREIVEKGKTTIWVIPILMFFSISSPIVSQNLDVELTRGIELYQSGKYAEAAPVLDSIIPIVRVMVGNLDTSLLTDLLHLTGLCYRNNNQFKKAEVFYKELIKIDREILGIKHPAYGVDLNDLGKLYQEMGMYNLAEPLLISSIRILKENYGENSIGYGFALNDLAVLYMILGKFDLAKPLMLETLQITKKMINPENPDYATILNNVAQLFTEMGLYEEAEPLMIEANGIDLKLLGNKHPSFAISLTNLARLYTLMGRYKQAESLIDTALMLMKQAYGENHVNYGTCLSISAQLYVEMGLYKIAEPMMVEAVRIQEEILGKYHPTYAQITNNLSQLYFKLGRYNQAESLMNESMEIYKQTLGENHPAYCTCLNNIAQLYHEIGIYEQAEQKMIEAIYCHKEVFGDTHPTYATDLNNLALLYTEMGRYKSAESTFITAMQIDKETYGEAHPSYARDLNNIAYLYKKMGQYELAETMMLKGLDINKKALGETHPSFSTNLNNLATLYIKLGKVSKAESLLFDAIRADRNNFGDNHPRYCRDLINLAVFYYGIGLYEKADTLLLEGMRKIKDTYGSKHPFYSTAIANLIQVYQNLGKFSQSDSLMTESFGIWKYQLTQNSGYLSENEYKYYTETILFNFDIYQSANFKRANSSEFVGQFAQIIELFRKGILLNNLTQVRESILRSNDTALVSAFQETQTLHKQAEHIYNLPKEERYLDPDSLIDIATRLEKNLTLQSKAYRKSVDEIDVTWEQIQDHLQPGEASIEFASFNFYDNGWTDSTLYCALVLRKDFEIPKMVYLFEEGHLKPILPIASGTNEDISMTYSLHHEESLANQVYNLIWAPLEPYLEGVEKVYISASGELNKLAFHALPDSEGSLLCNNYDLVQLSSTREVALSEEDNSIETFAVFGGVDYSLDTTEMLAMAHTQNTDGIHRAVYRGDTTARGLTLSYLPGTMEEAREIERECNTSGKEVEVFSGKLATEENFRSLEGSESPDVIHIATHGFYFPEEKTRDREERMRFMQTEQENQFIYSPDPLIRSGLALAGANHAWQGEKISEGVEDGILTARDVSRMNLMNTELVVLSACQTGLGDVKGSEGVYGLQRAFKMAGVRYLLMSLWKVPDESTKEFMVTFYKQLLSGESIRGSYQITQQVMSSKYPDDPFKWAAFILVE